MKRHCLRMFCFALGFALGLVALSLEAAQAQSPSRQEPQRPWTYYFLINGDRDYEGWRHSRDGSIKIVDMAWRNYKILTKIAQSDAKNAYVIYFDPRGQSSWTASDTTSRQDVYVRGRRIDTMDSRRDVNSASADEIHLWLSNANDVLDESRAWSVRESRKLFYFFGERIPVTATRAYDESHPNALFNVSRFVSGLEPFQYVGGIDVLFFHSCDAAEMRLLFPLVKTFQTQWIVTPIGTINRGELPHLATVLTDGGSAEELSLKLSQVPDSHYHHRLVRYHSKTLLNLEKVLAHLGDQAGRPAIESGIRTLLEESERAGSSPAELSSQASSVAAKKVSPSGEYAMRLVDYLLLIEQAMIAPAIEPGAPTLEENQARLVSLLTLHPELKELWISYHPWELGVPRPKRPEKEFSSGY